MGGGEGNGNGYGDIAKNGSLTLDAAAAPADMRYPTDLLILGMTLDKDCLHGKVRPPRRKQDHVPSYL